MRRSPPTTRPNKTDAGNGSKAICRVSNVHTSPSPDPRPRIVMNFTRSALLVFFVLSALNFTFPPRVGMAFPDHVARSSERKFYFSSSFHKTYVPDRTDPKIQQWVGSYNVHWSELAISECLLICALGSILTLRRSPALSAGAA